MNCIIKFMNFSGRPLFIRLQAQVGRGGMRQRVQCKVGMLSAFLVTVRLLSQLLRSVETFEVYFIILSVILVCVHIYLYIL